MPDRSLRGCRILIVEDEYMLADDLKGELEEADAVIIGPAGTLRAALDLIRSSADLDGAVVDINLRGEMAYPVADLLMERNVPFVFSTGYDEFVLPDRFAGIPRCEKPVNIDRIVEKIGRVIHAR